MANIYQMMPYLEGEELYFIQGVVKEFTEQQLQQFAAIYSARRKDPQLILLTALAGFIGLAGVQRFILGQIGMGILYFLTGGLCLIGTIIDLVNHKKLAYEFNFNVAREVNNMVKNF